MPPLNPKIKDNSLIKNLLFVYNTGVINKIPIMAIGNVLRAKNL